MRHISPAVLDAVICSDFEIDGPAAFDLFGDGLLDTLNLGMMLADEEEELDDEMTASARRALKQRRRSKAKARDQQRVLDRRTKQALRAAAFNL